MTKYKIEADVDYVMGHLRYGHFEVTLSEEEYKDFQKLSKSDQIEILRDGNLEIDDWEVEDIGDIDEEFRIVKINEN